ncbi:M20 family peptidase [Kribbella antibiotica]|uniref:M20 family peptidase n=1 Tax=Kribbella antibiotica TaxID=190195 RepID=A0A4R4YRX3_9ACTN|nr:M20/M25/M40 family metallo-hydrolase [Kribbella antibiotica]TDD47966.1 M20 family peptidase [Kribbella antibiotica]
MNLPLMMDRLRSYVEDETPTGDAPALNAFADRLVHRYAELGGTARRVAAATGDHVVADFPGRGALSDAAPVLFLAHHDTVWPVGQLAGAMPWRVEDGVIHGPGVFDMKGGLVILESALGAVSEADHRPVRVIVVADEEVGSPTARELVKAESAGVVAVFGLEPPHPNGDLKTSRWGSTRIRITVTGREAHAALDPESGISAIDELVDQLIAVRKVVAQHNHVLCNVGTIEGGGRTNVVAGSAWSDVGFRFVDPETEAAVLAAVTALPAVRDGAVVEVKVMSNRPAWQPSPATDELLAKVAAAGAEIGQQVGGAAAAGAADTNLTGWLGLPTLDGLGPVGKGAHAVHEQAIAATLTERAALVAAILRTI